MKPHKNKPASFVTISVDDGHPADLRTAGLLARYNLPATFYVPIRNPERPVLPCTQVRELSAAFEIGGHTLNHLPLTSVPQDRVLPEITEGKACLEDMLGQEVVSFCYPRGKYNGHIAAQVKKAGFAGARTCLFNRHDFPADPFAWGVSTHAHCHGRAVQVRHALLERNLLGAWNFVAVHRGATDWETHFCRALDHVESGGVAHLYFHSWEIDQFGEWSKLESVLRFISERPHLQRVTNGTLFRLWYSQHDDKIN